MVPDAQQPMRFGEFELDEGNARLTRAGEAVALPPKSFAVLCELARRPGQLTKKNALLDAVWGHRHVSESVLKTTVSQLRAALADDAAQPRFIETVSKLGYRFIGLAAAGNGADGRRERAATALPHSVESSPAGMIGRIAVLARLHEAWIAACGGRRQLLWLVGDPGIGKTTLIESFMLEVPQAIVARGQCIELYGAGEPFRPLLEALSSLARRFPDLARAMRSVAPTWLIQLPWLMQDSDRDLLLRELAGSSQERMIREFVELMARFTQNQPLLLIVEDLHWSDQATLRALDHFARSREPMRLLCLCSFRLAQVLADDHPIVPLRQELRLHKLCTEIGLDCFSPSEVGDYLQNRIPDCPAPESFVRQLHAHTGGLPLFVANVVESLMIQGSNAAPANPDWSRKSRNIPLPVPDNLTGAIEKQISRLTPDTRGVLEAASVCGIEFPASMLAEVLEQDLPSVRACCDRLTRQQYWLRETGLIEQPDGGIDFRVAFRHALYQHVFYGRIGAAQRVQFHRRAARSLENRRARGFDSAPAEIAAHYERGREPIAAVRHYATAAQSALSHFSPEEAAEIARHALKVLAERPTSSESMELELSLVACLGLAASHTQGIATPEARAAFERARELFEILPPSPRRALQMNGFGWMSFARGEYADSFNIARQAAALAEHYDDPVFAISACNLLGMTLAVTGEHAAACLQLERGIKTCCEIGDRVPITYFLHDPEVSMRAVLTNPLASRGLAEQARAQAALALERARCIGQPTAQAFSHRCAAALEMHLGNPDRVAVLVANLQKIAAAASIAQAVGALLWLRGWVTFQRGDARSGHLQIMEGFARQTGLGTYAMCAEMLGLAAEATLSLGDVDAAQKHVDDAMSLATRLGEKSNLPGILLIKAKVALARNDRAGAYEFMCASLSEARRQEALALELKAQVALASLEPGAAHIQPLAATYARITEGFDLPVCARARQLLGAHPA